MRTWWAGLAVAVGVIVGCGGPPRTLPVVHRALDLAELQDGARVLVEGELVLREGGGFGIRLDDDVVVDVNAQASVLDWQPLVGHEVEARGTLSGGAQAPRLAPDTDRAPRLMPEE